MNYTYSLRRIEKSVDLLGSANASRHWIPLVHAANFKKGRKVAIKALLCVAQNYFATIKIWLD